KINLYKSHQIEVCNGGTLFEISYSQGKINEFFIKMKELGLSSVEISDGKIDIDSNEKGRIIEKAKNFGFKVYSEIGKKDPELDMKLNCKQRISHALNDLKVGARKVIMESRASGKLGIYDENCQVKENFVKKLVDGIGLDNIIFEAPRKNQQLWLILNFGSEVNLGNIKVKDVIPLETLRKGVRGDTFGKIP
ncbi:MAG: phosphosulfolactate synthase, partial [Candidatus Lokiarchaeota archaeon]